MVPLNSLKFFLYTPLEPPSFVTKPASKDVLPGSVVCLKSTFQGSTPFTIRWFKGDKELVSGGNCYINKEALESSLELYSVKTTDSGTYTCKVSNVAGAVECSATLFVKGLQNFLDIFELPLLVLASFSRL